ncbi:hypothetical protein [Dactylosporangium sp. NPDC051541]|uniref:hypothetical protein n=1 Tax=Dactylosporangium sp. NPDC051541 TaxID=3363977 RepID=UPI00378F35B1
MERHGGTIYATGNPTGSGTRMTFGLPADADSRTEVEAAEPVPAESETAAPMHGPDVVHTMADAPNAAMPAAVTFEHAAHLVLEFLHDRMPRAFWGGHPRRERPPNIPVPGRRQRMRPSARTEPPLGSQLLHPHGGRRNTDSRPRRPAGSRRTQPPASTSSSASAPTPVRSSPNPTAPCSARSAASTRGLTSTIPGWPTPSRCSRRSAGS